MKVIGGYPKAVETFTRYNLPQYIINYDIVEQDGLYVYNKVSLPLGKFDYATIADALINEEYPQDKMWAIVNNYLLNPLDEDSKAKFEKMQQDRIRLKELAKRLVEEYQ